MRAVCGRFVCFFAAVFLVGCGSGGIPPATGYNIVLAVYKPLCLDVLNASKVNGDKVVPYPCGNREPNQQWELRPVANGAEYSIVNINSNFCMAVFDQGVTAPGQVVIQETCQFDGSRPNQVWSIKKDPTQAGYNIINKASAQCLDLPYGAIVAQFQMQQYLCVPDDPAQAWSFIPSRLGVRGSF